MQITCATVDGQIEVVECEASSTMEDIKVLLSASFEVGVGDIKLTFKEDSNIPDDAQLKDVGIEDNDMIAVEIIGSEQEPERNRLSLSRMTTMDVMQQKLIEREIAMKNIQENMAEAIDENPESFASVLMLYIDTTVNGVPVKAFVDSGAQSTVMSRKCAEQCGIMRLVDPRFAGVAVGVGTQRILGRVHRAPIVIGSVEYKCSFTILDGETNMDLLLGLDQMRKLQMVIDLKNDCLHVGDSNEIIPFLPENEVPQHARLS